MSAPGHLTAPRSLRQDMAWVLLFRTLVALGLALSSWPDSRRAGHAVTLARAAALMLPLMLPQTAFSLVVAWLLHRRPQWLDRPMPLLAAALAVIPAFLLLATPLVVAIGVLTRGQPWSAYGRALSDWTAFNIWADAMTAGAGLALQIGWASGRHAQVQREAALLAHAENLSLLRSHLVKHLQRGRGTRPRKAASE